VRNLVLFLLNVKVLPDNGGRQLKHVGVYAMYVRVVGL